MNNGQKILARIVELTNSPLNIVSSQAIGTSTEDSDWDILVPFQYKSEIMKMISEFSITTDTHWYEENSYDGEKLFEHKNVLTNSGVRMYIPHRGTEYKIDLLFSNSILNSQIESAKISLIGIPAILNKNSTFIYDLIVQNKNHTNIDIEKFRLEWEQNIITQKVREFKQFCGLNWMATNKEFDDFVNVHMNFKLILNQISMFTFNQYCPTNLEKYKL